MFFWIPFKSQERKWLVKISPKWKGTLKCPCELHFTVFQSSIIFNVGYSQCVCSRVVPRSPSGGGGCFVASSHGPRCPEWRHRPRPRRHSAFTGSNKGRGRGSERPGTSAWQGGGVMMCVVHDTCYCGGSKLWGQDSRQTAAASHRLLEFRAITANRESREVTQRPLLAEGVANQSFLYSVNIKMFSKLNVFRWRFWWTPSGQNVSMWIVETANRLDVRSGLSSRFVCYLLDKGHWGDIDFSLVPEHKVKIVKMLHFPGAI